MTVLDTLYFSFRRVRRSHPTERDLIGEARMHLVCWALIATALVLCCVQFTRAGTGS